MVELHGGVLSVTSKEGIGTTILIKLPLYINKIYLYGEIKINRCIIILGDLYIRLIGRGIR